MKPVHTLSWFPLLGLVVFLCLTQWSHIAKGQEGDAQPTNAPDTAPTPGDDGAQGQSAPGLEAAKTKKEEPTKTLSPGEWKEEYRLFNELVSRFGEGVQLFEKDVQSFIEQKHNDEQRRIQQTYDERNKRLQDEVRVCREQAIAAFERFIQKYPQSEHTPLAMFRLAELYYDEASEEFFAAEDAYDKLLANMDSDTANIPEAPKYDYSKSLALYERIQREFPDFKHADGVYFMRGFLYGKETAEQYDPETAKDIWLALIREHPDSQYASFAYLRVGKYYFEKGTDADLHTAIEYYQKVMSYRDNRFDQALYMVAWAYYKLSDYENAIARFIDLIDFSQTKAQETGRESALRTEAVQYLAISFADSGDVNDALKFFKEIGDRPYKLEVLKKLADMYSKQAKFEQAIEAYTVLQDLFPDNEENPEFQDEIVRILRMPPADFERANDAAEVLIRRYSPDSEWWQQQGQNRPAMSESQKLAEKQLRQLAFYYHGLANDTDSPDEAGRYYTKAAQKYREYLIRFPYSDQAYELQFYFAECLFFSQEFAEAAQQFQKAMTYTNPKYHVDAARGVVDSYIELIKADGLEGVLMPYPAQQQQKRDAEEKIPEPIPLSPLRKKYIQAIDVLSQVAPDEETAAKPLFIAAQTFFYHNQFKEAEKRYNDFIERYPNNEFADSAAVQLVDLLKQQHEWVAVMNNIDRLVKLELGDDSRDWNRIRGELMVVREQAHRKQAEQLAREGKSEENKGQDEEKLLMAVKEYEAIGGDKDLFNAATILEQLGKVDRAIEDYKLLTKRYPKSDLVEESLFRIATNYEKYFDLPRAIEYHELLARNYPKSEHAKDSLINAALLRVGLHQYKEAARSFERYSQVYPDSSDAEATLFAAAQHLLRAEDYGEAVRVFRKYLKLYYKANGDRTMEAHTYIISSLEKLGRYKEARDQERKTPAIVAALKDMDTFTPIGKGLYAQIMFKDMERTMDQFQRGKFTGNSAAQAKMLDTKLQLIATLESKMMEILKIGDVEWYSAAVFTVGLAYHTFADDLRDAVPSELSDEDREMYMVIIEEEYIFPFEDKALMFYSRNLELESAQKVWNVWIEKTYERLNALRPDLYPARKKEKTRSVGDAQDFVAPPILSVPLAFFGQGSFGAVL